MEIFLQKIESPKVVKMFSKLYGVNNKHPLIDLSTSAVRCLKCFEAIIVLPEDKNALTALLDNSSELKVAHSVRTTPCMADYKPYGSCKCSNVACMLDEQSTLRVYVEDIRTVHIGYAVFGKSTELLGTYYKEYSETLNYVDYTVVKNTLSTFVPIVPKKVKKTKPKILTLVEALDLGAQGVARTFFYDTKD